MEIAVLFENSQQLKFDQQIDSFHELITLISQNFKQFSQKTHNIFYIDQDNDKNLIENNHNFTLIIENLAHPLNKLTFNIELKKKYEDLIKKTEKFKDLFDFQSLDDLPLDESVIYSAKDNKDNGFIDDENSQTYSVNEVNLEDFTESTMLRQIIDSEAGKDQDKDKVDICLGCDIDKFDKPRQMISNEFILRKREEKQKEKEKVNGVNVNVIAEENKEVDVVHLGYATIEITQDRTELNVLEKKLVIKEENEKNLVGVEQKNSDFEERGMETVILNKDLINGSVLNKVKPPVNVTEILDNEMGGNIKNKLNEITINDNDNKIFSDDIKNQINNKNEFIFTNEAIINIIPLNCKENNGKFLQKNLINNKNLNNLKQSELNQLEITNYHINFTKQSITGISNHPNIDDERILSSSFSLFNLTNKKELTMIEENPLDYQMTDRQHNTENNESRKDNLNNELVHNEETFVNFSCFKCKIDPIVKCAYYCVYCNNILCVKCEENHDNEHTLIKFKSTKELNSEKLTKIKEIYSNLMISNGNAYNNKEPNQVNLNNNDNKNNKSCEIIKDSISFKENTNIKDTNNDSPIEDENSFSIMNNNNKHKQNNSIEIDLPIPTKLICQAEIIPKNSRLSIIPINSRIQIKILILNTGNFEIAGSSKIKHRTLSINDNVSIISNDAIIMKNLKPKESIEIDIECKIIQNIKNNNKSNEIAMVFELFHPEFNFNNKSHPIMLNILDENINLPFSSSKSNNFIKENQNKQQAYENLNDFKPPKEIKDNKFEIPLQIPKNYIENKEVLAKENSADKDKDKDKVDIMKENEFLFENKRQIVEKAKMEEINQLTSSFIQNNIQPEIFKRLSEEKIKVLTNIFDCELTTKPMEEVITILEKYKWRIEVAIEELTI